MKNHILLQVSNLACNRQNKILFTHISFQLQKSAAIVVEGPNGSGKSSLLRLLAGLATPMQGEIHWHTPLQENLLYMSHTNGIKLGLTVLENLQLACEFAQTAPTNFDFVLEELQLLPYRHSSAANLSAGQKRKIALAKLWLIPKLIWILDEPMTALDASTQKLFLSILEKHLNHGGAAILSSHHPITLKHANITTLSLSA